MDYSIKDIFLAGYVSAQAGTYFNQVIMVTELAEYDDENVIEEYASLFKKVKESGKLYVDNIKYVAQVANKHRIPLPDLPKHPEQYFKWIKAVQLGFSGERMPEEISPAYFTHASHLGDLTTSLYILDNYIYLHQKFGALDYSESIKTLLDDILKLRADVDQVNNDSVTPKNQKTIDEGWKTLFDMAGQFAEFRKEELRQEELEELGELVNQLIDKSSSYAHKIAEKL